VPPASCVLGVTDGGVRGVGEKGTPEAGLAVPRLLRRQRESREETELGWGPERRRRVGGGGEGGD
jgi:hypothetical protein